LGSFNLPRYLIWNEAEKRWDFQWSLLASDIPNVVRAMDNVVDRARYPLPEQRAEAQAKRRMGLGVTGLANCIEAMGHPYGSPAFLQMEDQLLAFITRECYIASAMLAKDKGSFPMYDEEKYLAGQFIKSLDDDVRDLIKKYGIRNSHLTSIAPTGTISFTADNVSSGIEPVFGYEQERNVIMPEGKIKVKVPDYGASVLGVEGKRMADVSAEEHIKVLCTAQRHIDSSVSKTCNVPTNYPYDKFKNLYISAYEGGAKGCTTYRPNGNYEDVISSADVAETKDFSEGEACGFDPETGARTGPCAD
jgi:ribonucleoside-diphosphate reductase alpha chain